MWKHGEIGQELQKLLKFPQGKHLVLVGQSRKYLKDILKELDLEVTNGFIQHIKRYLEQGFKGKFIGWLAEFI